MGRGKTDKMMSLSMPLELQAGNTTLAKVQMCPIVRDVTMADHGDIMVTW